MNRQGKDSSKRNDRAKKWSQQVGAEDQMDGGLQLPSRESIFQGSDRSERFAANLGLTPATRKAMLQKQYARWGSFLTLPPKGYLIPTDRQITERLGTRAGGCSYGFVRELCNLAAGGRFSPPSLWGPVLDQLQKQVPLRKEESEASRRGRVHKAVEQMADFLKTLDFSQVPGSDPLEKASWIIKALSKAGYSADLPGSGGVNLPIGSNSQGKAWNNYERIYDDFRAMDETDFALILADEPGRMREGSALDKRHAVLESLLDNPIKRQMATIGRQLSQIDGISVVPQVTITPNAHGEDVRRRQMRDPQELPRIDKHQWALLERAPQLFWQRVMSREMCVREKVTRTDKKQLLYLLIDCSGSMDSDGGKRIGAACGVLMNRLRAVIEGKAELYYRFFDGAVHPERHVRTKEEAIKAMQDVLSCNFSGGSTDINKAIRTGQDRIEVIAKEGKLYRPHLVVVTDGGDTISLRANNLINTTLHAVLCMCTNSDLTKLAKDTNGLALHIKDDEIRVDQS
jgi:Mg-chelatase subunit ChlD